MTSDDRQRGTVYAKYVGRVGALAVALGVAGAVVTHPGVAWADDTPSSTDSGSEAPSSGTEAPDTDPASPSSGTQQASNSPSTLPSTDHTPTTSATDPSGESDGGPAAPTGSETVTTHDGGVIVRSSGGAHTSDADTTDGDPADDEATDEAPETTSTGSDEQPSADITSDEIADTTDNPGPVSATPPKNENDAAAPQPAANLADPTADAKNTNLQAHSTSDTATTQLMTVTTNPAASEAPKAVAALPKLPTPQEVVHQVEAAVTTCACTVINQALKLVNGMLAQLVTPSPATPTAPAETPILWTVLGWVRRQVDQAVEAFGRTPPGRFIHQVTTQITDAIVDFGNSPFGRQISTQIAEFLQQCQGSTALPADLDRTTVVAGLNEPTDFAFLADKDHPDQIDRILITEKSGAIRVYDPQTGDLTTLVKLPTVTADGERGLVGIEVDPHFWTAGKEGYHTIYVAYTGADNYDRLSSLTVSDSLDQVINEDELLKSTELGNNFHHGGELQFDPQGRYLYWAVGDNTDSSNAQDLTNIHGKILRLNRDGTAPADNPFVKVPNAVKQIYAYGFRNPFRFTFAPDGQLLVADVGESAWEELNVVTAGANYGWPSEEGSCSGCEYVNPIYAYPHSDTPAHAGSITSVVVYTGDALPASYQNKVFIADYSVGWIKELTFDSEFTSLISERTFDSDAGATVKLDQGPDGNLYQLNIYPGQLSVIASSGGNRAPTAVVTASSTYGPDDSLEVHFSSRGSTDPDGNALTYQWDFGNGKTSTEADPTMVFTNTGDYTAYTVTLTVSDGTKTGGATQRIVVGSTPPTADIAVSETTYDAGDSISFRAVEAMDDQDGPLPASAYKWTVVFRHADHQHPFEDNIVGPSGSITIPRTPDQLSNTFYHITLTVTDSSGLSTTRSVDVNPNLVSLTFNASSPDATYTIDGIPHKGSYTDRAVVGVERVLNAPSPQFTGDGQLVFGSWSDGGTQNHVIVTPATNASYTATYDLLPSTLTALTT
jgi:glucose/arabinose dehydrogenase